MELFQFARNIREIRIEDRIAFCFPPKPILNNCVERNVLFTIPMCDPKNLVLRNVAIL